MTEEERKAYNRAKSARWRARNPEYAKAYIKRWRAANPEKAAELLDRWRADNPEKVREHARRVLAKNPQKNRDRVKEWVAVNPEKHRTQNRNRRARVMAADGSHTATEIAALLKSQKGKCVYCRDDIRSRFCADYIIPLARGGSNWISNIQLTCKVCNSRKHIKDAIAFAQELGRLL